MYRKKTYTLLVTALLGSALLFTSGCAKKKLQPPPQESSDISSTKNDLNFPPAEDTGSYTESSLGSEEHLDSSKTDNLGGLSVNSAMEEGSDEYKREHGRSSAGLSPIYYNFDESAIRPDMVDRMVNNASFLKELSSAKVVVEGNCDERGTNEYNLALGQRRALTAKKYLVNMGVAASRIRAVSYGEERPLFLGQDEQSFAQNRRSDFVLE